MSPSDIFLYSPSENPDLPFFAPPPQLADAPSPESFDKEVGDLDLDWSFEQIFSTFRDNVPASGPSAWTYSTDSSYDIASTRYSCGITPSATEYSIPSDIETRDSVNDGLYTHGSPPFPPLNPVMAQSDHGMTDLFPNFVGISRNDISAEQQPSPCGILPVREMFDSEAQVAPVKVVKPFKCPHCPFASARKHNLKTHVGTHNKEESNRFGCKTCRRRFSRKHDLHRHCTTIHGDQMSSPGISSRRFDPKKYHTTINGGPSMTSSAYSDSPSSLNPDSGVPEDIMALYREFEACLQEV